MISLVLSFKLCFLCAVFMRCLFFLVLTLGIDPGVPNDTSTKESSFPIFPPQSSESPYPRLLNERDVIHYKDSQGQFMGIGSGTFANVTLGELKGSKFHIVVKSFKGSPFREILKEIRLHRYAERLGITPILIGLLPSGPLAGNISLVYEYAIFSKPLDDLLDNYQTLSTIQWLEVCRQISLSLLRLHQNDVLFNDLHRGNVLIQKRGDRIRVYLIDFGFATYKSGKVYSSSYGNFSGYNFIAPELKNRLSSTKATDVFALGYMLLRIATKIKLPSLHHLAYWCLADQPDLRPLLLNVIARLDNILFEVILTKNNEMGKSNLHNKDRRVVLSTADYLTLNAKSIAIVSDIYLICPAISSIPESTFEQEVTSDWLWLTHNILPERCRVPLFVLDEHDLLKQQNEDITWLSQADNNAIRLAQLKLTNETVIVKEFYQVHFERIREEACRTGLLGQFNVSPKIIGILIEYKNMNDISFVQEFYGKGVSLTEFISVSSGHEWKMEILKKAATRELEIEYPDNFAKILGESCEFNKFKIFTDIISNWGTCKVKSYRRLIMERISILLIGKIILVHNSGYLLNNCRTNNILIKWGGNKTEIREVDIRIIDLGMTSSVQTGLFMEKDSRYVSRLTYLAPEVVQGHKTSRSSDVYSLCLVLYCIMQDYFSTSLMPLSRDKYITLSSKFDRLYNHFSSHRTANNLHLELGSNTSELKDNDIAFHKYHLLLLKCIHRLPKDRPNLEQLLFASSIAFIY